MKILGWEIRRVRNHAPVSLTDAELLDRLTLEADDPTLQAVDEILSRCLEDARNDAEDLTVAAQPQQLAFVCGGASYLRAARDRIADTRDQAILRARGVRGQNDVGGV